METHIRKPDTRTSVWGDLRWHPDRDLIVALVSYVLVVTAMVLAFQVFTTARVAANFITFGPMTLAALGVGVPILYTVLVRRQPISELGVTSKRLVPSLFFGLILGWDTYRNTLSMLDLTWNQAIVPVATMVLAVGFFEAVFFRGWLQLRFEDSFGLVPSLILGALFYSFYHIGYGMEWGEMLFLFGLGLTFAIVFRLMRNIFVLWPFYTPMGGLYTNLNEGLTMPFEATYGFIITIVMMIGLVILGIYLYRRTLRLE